MLAAKMMMAVGAAQGKLYVDDVFSSYLRTGTGADVVVTTGINMTEGYMLWTKGRSGATDHAIYDSARGVTFDLVSNSTAAQTTQATGLKAVSTTGHTVGSLAKMNTSGATYVDWVFRTADKFFKPTTISHTNGTPTNIAFPSLETLGMVVAKRTDSTGGWIVWHRSLTGSNNLRLNTTAAQSTTDAWLSVSGTTATLSASAPTGSYVVYGWAHDTSADGMIQCGSYFGNASTNNITLNYEPQFLIIKQSSGSGGEWYLMDTMRGMTAGGTPNYLTPNSSNAEETISAEGVAPTATGFTVNSSTVLNLAVASYIYLAIRRQNKPPTTGTQVFSQSAASGVFNAGFPVDMHLGFSRAGVASNTRSHSRLAGGTKELVTSSTAAEATVTDVGFDSSTGLRLSFGSNEINYLFKRATGFMDVVCYTGTAINQTVNHNLGTIPEMIIVKKRNSTAPATDWAVYHTALGNTRYLFLSTANASSISSGFWNNTTPTNSAFYIGSSNHVNDFPFNGVAYLFATLAGISKVGSYTGNGSTQTINCGFATGARFVLIKRTDSTGDWYVWDTARGIIAGNDPHLSLNTTAAEVTTDDSIDPDSSGFIVNQVAATNINVNAASYIYLAIA